jgi:hypothetical protein
MAQDTIRTVPVRFTHGPLGLIDAANPYRFADPIVNVGDVGELIVEGELPFAVPEDWALVKVGELYCPTHPATLEVIR